MDEGRKGTRLSTHFLHTVNRHWLHLAMQAGVPARLVTSLAECTDTQAHVVDKAPSSAFPPSVVLLAVAFAGHPFSSFSSSTLILDLTDFLTPLLFFLPLSLSLSVSLSLCLS